MSNTAVTCLLLLSLMSDKNIPSSRSFVTLIIFLEVFLHNVDMLRDCTFCIKKEIGGNLGGGASKLSIFSNIMLLGSQTGQVHTYTQID